MLPIDLVIVGLAVLLAIWGFMRGLTVGMLALVGFAVGAVLGSRVAPLVLNGGLNSPDAPILALPGALLAGGLMAAAVEWLVLRRRHWLSRLGPADGIAGALLAACLGLVAAWGVGAAVVQVKTLRDPVERSAILERMNDVLPPPGPVVASEPAPSDRFPTLDAPGPDVPKANPRIARDPQVKAAFKSVLHIAVESCDGDGTGSGWIVADGIVATNAHVVAGEEITTVRTGRGEPHPATPIWWDKKNDIALLRAPAFRGMPPLPLARKPSPGAEAAILGFPAGRRPGEIRPGRLGPTTDRRQGNLSDARLQEFGFPTNIYGRLITSFLGRSQPGNSGGPVVDGRGRVLTTVFGGSGGGSSGLGVPNAFVRRALRRAGPPVKAGSCED
ncbi:MAG: MarP family serine protease [Thermoleophilaceae bacterium]|nr:MarP family serine protease [Thermoleophilaceae bacterium]